jgi:hypothetical protein
MSALPFKVALRGDGGGCEGNCFADRPRENLLMPRSPTRDDLKTAAIVLQQRLEEYVNILREDARNIPRRRAAWLAFDLAQKRLRFLLQNPGAGINDPN